MSDSSRGGKAVLPADVREALDDLQRYLSDAIAPLMVVDAIERLLAIPPAFVAREIESWVAAQDGAHRHAVPLSDYLYHALQKIHAVGELGLVPKDALHRTLSGVTPFVLQICPEGDREHLLENLRRLGRSEAVLAAPVSFIHRQAGSGSPLAKEPTAIPSPSFTTGTFSAVPTGAAPAATLAARPAPQAPPLSVPVEEQVRREVRRFSLLLERLAAHTRSADETASLPGHGAALRSQLLLSAAGSAHSGAELDRLLARLSRMGLDTSGDDLFKTLAAALPAWTVPDAAAPTPASAEAMKRILALTDDPSEVAGRLHSLVSTAVEHFNKGSLPRAETMLDLAAQAIRDKRIEKTLHEPIQLKAQAALDVEKLKQYADDATKHAHLRRVLGFFPALTVSGLLDSLETEQKRDRRRLLLSLVEVHGEKARVPILDRLAQSLPAGDESWHIQRNLVYLLRRLPRAATDTEGGEDVELLALLAEPSRRAPLVKEALAGLAQMKGEKAEQRLIARVQDVERLLLAKGPATPSAEPLETYLDRAVAALVRMGTPGARAAVVEHALREKPGSARALPRLAELSGLDLSRDEKLVDRIVRKLRATLPLKVLRFVVKKEMGGGGLDALIASLTGTPHPKVREVFEEIVRDYPNQAFVAAASRALLAWDAAKPAEAGGFTGDLAVFGLPDLLQSLANNESTGILTLRSAKGEDGKLLLERGCLRAAQAGRLTGDEALYQLFEKPRAGAFAYAKQGLPAPAASEPPARPILPMILEGMRRYDEFQRARSLVADDAVLRPTGLKPSPHPEERDPLLMQGVWAGAASGRTPGECESRVLGSSFRVRRLLAHWVEEGALVPTTADPASATGAGKAV